MKIQCYWKQRGMYVSWLYCPQGTVLSNTSVPSAERERQIVDGAWISCTYLRRDCTETARGSHAEIEATRDSGTMRPHKTFSPRRREKADLRSVSLNGLAPYLSGVEFSLVVIGARLQTWKRCRKTNLNFSVRSNAATRPPSTCKMKLFAWRPKRLIILLLKPRRSFQQKIPDALSAKDLSVHVSFQ